MRTQRAEEIERMDAEDQARRAAAAAERHHQVEAMRRAWCEPCSALYVWPADDDHSPTVSVARCRVCRARAHEATR